MTSGDVDVTQTWNGAAYRIRQQLPTVQYAYPKEGIEGWMDNVAVLKDAPNMENAKAVPELHHGSGERRADLRLRRL